MSSRVELKAKIEAVQAQHQVACDGNSLFFGSLLLYGPKFTNKVFAGPLGRTIARWNGLGAWNANPLCDIIYFIAKKCWWVW